MQKTLRDRRTRRSGLALGLAAILATSLGLMAPAASADDDVRPIAPDTHVPYLPQDPTYVFPKVGEIDKSANMELLSNVPIQAGQATLSNLVFWDHYVAQGSYNGLVIYDITDPAAPVVVSNTVCAGYQGDLSKAGDLIFFSVDQPRNGSACGAATAAASSSTAWEGIRIFNVANPASPQYVGNVKTRCGSHTHTQVANPDDPNSVYLYNGSYDTTSTGFYCNNPHLRMEIIKVPLNDPASASIAKEIILWDEDPNTENPPPFKTTDRTDGGASTTATIGCHDITAYPAKHLLAAACEGDGLLMDITDPLNPIVKDRVRDANFAFWHTAQFNNDATKMIFQDELGGGSSAVCTPSTQNFRGANAFYSVSSTKKLTLKSYFKIPRRQGINENCVTHEGNILPVEGKDIFVQAFYQGGVSVIDFTDITKPKEIGFFDRGPISATSLVTGGYWATYFKDGFIFGSEIARGLDTLKLSGSEFSDAMRYRYPNPYNPSTQPEYKWGWKTAPVVPAGTLGVATVTPAALPAGSTADVTVAVPAGTFTAGEFFDVWSSGSGAAVLGTGKAAADGSASATFAVPAGSTVGVTSFIVRGDKQLDAALYRAPLQVHFSDVGPAHQFFTEINWAVANGVAKGYADGTFKPNNKVERQALIHYLYNASHPGVPAPACTVKPFTDVPLSSTFCGDIAWAKANGITLGNADGTFLPVDQVSREAAAAFIFRTVRSITPSTVAPACTTKPFPDVAVNSTFCAEIAWAASNDIVKGFEDGKFYGSSKVARDAAAAFVYRAFSS
ncbi:hypothetical protein D1871_09870 [Nakamurella silvestris]|nr:hypothetical protein D1871_09870 [Nakamurella silvestris]